MKRILIVGCGFVGNEIVRLYKAAERNPSSNFEFFALTRTSARAEELQGQGVQPIIGHWHDISTLSTLPEFDSIIVSVPHREDSGLGVDSHVRGLQNLMQCQPSVRRFIYLSTTGVYGDAHDEVDELTPTQPTRIGPQIAVAAEQWLLERYTPPKLAIIRLAGIYGPGRIPLAEKLKSGETLQVPQEGWLNLVHVSDIAAMLLQVIEQDLTKPLYVFSDGNPVPRMDFYRTLAQLCGVDEPKFAPPDPNATRTQRAGKKRVNPLHLIDELKFSLQFGSYKEGLANSL